jgi:hypothetical protein
MFRLGAKARSNASRDQDSADVRKYLAHGNAACGGALFKKWEHAEKNQHKQLAVVQGSLKELVDLRERVNEYAEATQESMEYFFDNDHTISSVHAPNYQHMMAMECPKEFSIEIASVDAGENPSTHPEYVVQMMLDRVTAVVKYTQDLAKLHEETHKLLNAAVSGATAADICGYFRSEIKRRKQVEAEKKRKIERHKKGKKSELPLMWTSPPKFGKGNVTSAALPPSPDRNEEDFEEDLAELNLGNDDDEDEDADEDADEDEDE